MLCYRCGSHVPEGANKCLVCGHVFNNSGRSSSLNAEKGRSLGPLKEGQTFADRYLVKDLLAIGSIGWLYRGRDQDMDIDVVIKVIAPNLLQTPEEQNTFLAAAKNARKVRHPNIIRIFDSGHEEGLLYYTMPYTQGLSLEKIISLRQENNEHFSMAELYGLFAQIASAIDALSGYGPICTLKPSNIIVLPDLLKITGVPDFVGLPHFPYVAMQRKKGTLDYMAPAAQKDGSVLDIKADIFSMAVILGEMLTGYRAPEKAEMFEQSISFFPNYVRQAFKTALLQEVSEAYPYEGAYDFVTAVFPEEAAQESAMYDEPGHFDETTLKTFEGETILDVGEVTATVTTVTKPEQTQNDLSLSEETVLEMPPLPPEEELELNADEMEEEALMPPPPLEPATPVVAAASLMAKTEVKPAQMPLAQTVAEPVGDTMPSFAGIPQHLRVEPIAEKPVRDTLLINRPPKKVKKSHGGLVAFLTVLLLGAAICAAFWFMNKDQRDLQKIVAPVSDSQTDRQNSIATAIESNDDASESEKADGHRKADKDRERNRNSREQRGKFEKEVKAHKDPVKEAASTEIKEERKTAEPVENKEAVNASPVQQPEQPATPIAEQKPEQKIIIVRNDATKERAPVVVTAASKEGPKEEPKLPPEKPAQEEAAKKVVQVTTPVTPMPVVAEDEAKGTCPADMIFVPAGTFQMGSPESDTMRDFDDKTISAKYVKGFCIDVYEYPNKEGTKPVQSLTYAQAQKLCQQKGKRLCREEEWEKACKGANNYRFPYGNRISNTQCNTGAGGVVASGQYSRCKSPYGVFDMAGNVTEWTSTKLEPDIPDRIYKGGAYGANAKDTRCAARHGGDTNSHEATMGARCCKNPL